MQFANWGAECTLVDVNDKACKIARDVFDKYTTNPHKHEIICSSVFHFVEDKKRDIVVTNGMIHHTDDNEGAFNKIASYVSPGGFLVLGLGNKAGGFQNMLQRMIIFEFADNDEEIVDLAMRLFEENFHRSQKFSKRSINSIIYDRFVVPKQDDPSVSEVLRWFTNNELNFYSSYPAFMPPVFSDSHLNSNTFRPQDFTDMGVLAEAYWMVRGDDDCSEVPNILQSFKGLSRDQFTLTEYVNDMNRDSGISLDSLPNYIESYQSALGKVEITYYLRRKSVGFFTEVNILIGMIKERNIEKISVFLKNTQYLFRGFNGLRNIYFVGYKPEI